MDYEDAMLTMGLRANTGDGRTSSWTVYILEDITYFTSSGPQAIGGASQESFFVFHTSTCPLQGDYSGWPASCCCTVYYLHYADVALDLIFALLGAYSVYEREDPDSPCKHLSGL